MKYFTRIVLTFLFLFLCSTFFISFHYIAATGTELHFIDVGQGDSILIQRGNYQILIDGGPDDSVLAGLGKIMPLDDKELEIVVLTHPHADHLTGLNLILDRYKVDQIYGSAVVYNSDQYISFLSKIKEKKIDFSVPEKGKTIIPFANSTLRFLWPGSDYQQKTIENINNSSVVSQFCYFQQCVLLTGDIEKDEQDKMLDYYKDDLAVFKSALYKVPHHGSSNGANDRIYQAVMPKYSIISVGKKNSYGHPSNVALKLSEQNNSQILRTDLSGTISFLLNDESIILNK